MRAWTSVAVLTVALSGGAQADPLGEPPHPSSRAASEPGAVQLASVGVEKSLRPALRPSATGQGEPAVQSGDSNQRFQNWIGAFKDRARSQGISETVLEQAFDGVTYDADIIKRDRNQSEFTKTIWDYLDSAASETRIANGKASLAQHGRTLDAIEQRYGVEKEVVVAVWGLESAYGTYRGKTDIIRALATLSFDARRSQFFEQQLIAALKILQNGDTTPRKMTGSWAGAMGHTQFIPTSYLDYAVDFTGDGKRDIWSDDPTDALASTAAYLARFGWETGKPWGVEVRLPKGFDYRLADRKIERLPSDWARLGVVSMAGQPVADHGAASVLLPAGGKGAAFLIFRNFSVIERYNAADAYVIGVGHLSDRIKGGPAIQAAWPRDDRALTLKERKEMQERLTARGFDTQGVDGRIGPLTISAVRAFQVASGLTPDGYASLGLLNRLR
ncbi:lytic murein transglycosylase [Sedimentitalea sp. JM2-8]|uniref:Lytic murein transglycosylase n=1 Tax=Sedimentitalea xiamensis TaxID=3050037 RepID=A0ABT7F9I8_9RHOB|nr:lytic murein transglycosylase [Sedimentitalea xiamensis]MDK3071630.1 lytic murein transglycosylase [Sedimentitalea xiamensis]